MKAKGAHPWPFLMSLSSDLKPLIIAGVIVGSLVLAYTVYVDTREEEARIARAEARESARETARAAREESYSEQREGSSALMPEPLAGVEIGMSRAELERMRENTSARDPDENGDIFLEENLPNGSQVLFRIDEHQNLEAIQVLSALPAEGVGPHIRAMRESYGAPNGLWRCAADGVPTLRFTWQRGPVSMQDILLIHDGGVALTLYLGGTGAIVDSLRQGGCVPVRNRAELQQLPITTREALRDHAVGQANPVLPSAP